MSFNLQTRRAKCASEIALAESIRMSREVPDPKDSAFIKGAKAALKLLNRKLAVQEYKTAQLVHDKAVITRETRYAEMH